MAIRDIFYACPACGAEGTIAASGKEERCRGCGAAYRRAAGAAIRMRDAQGREETRAVAEWLDRLPPPVELPPGETAGPDRAILRVSGGPRPIRRGRELLGWGERFGRRVEGTVELSEDALVFRPERGDVRRWPLERITAVQPTSSALQVKARGEPVAYLRFLDGSVRLWEHRIQQRLRALYRQRGLGEIVEFQPRVTTR